MALNATTLSGCSLNKMAGPHGGASFTATAASFPNSRSQPAGSAQRKETSTAERLLQALPGLIDDGAVRPSLVHGDLWGGNWLATAQGPALIDPAVYFGDREMDLAMASLFGGFPDSFFHSYHEAFPLLAGPCRTAPPLPALLFADSPQRLR